jgi:hypothetical protein
MKKKIFFKIKKKFKKMELIFDLCLESFKENGEEIYSPNNEREKKKLIVIGSPLSNCIERMKKYEKYDRYIFDEIGEIDEIEGTELTLSELKKKYGEEDFKWDEEIKENWNQKKDENLYGERLERFVEHKLWKQFKEKNGVDLIVIVSTLSPCKFLSAMLFDPRKRFQRIKLIQLNHQNKNKIYSIHNRFFKNDPSKFNQIVSTLGNLKKKNLYFNIFPKKILNIFNVFIF